MGQWEASVHSEEKEEKEDLRPKKNLGAPVTNRVV